MIGKSRWKLEGVHYIVPNFINFGQLTA